MQGMKKKKKKKIKNKIKSQEPAVEQQREDVSSTFGWYFPGQILLKGIGVSGLLAAVREPLAMGCLVWGRGHEQVLLQDKVGAVGEAGAAVTAFGWDVGRPRECTVPEPGVSLGPSLSAGCWAGPRSSAPLPVPDRFPSSPDLYRRAMLALKMRQEQRKQQSTIVP